VNKIVNGVANDYEFEMPFEKKFDVKYNEKYLEEYSKKVNEFSSKYLSQDLIIKKQQQELERYKNIIDEAIESIERGYVVFCEQDEQCLLNFRKNLLKKLKGDDK